MLKNILINAYTPNALINTPESIAEIDAELKELAPKIKKENDRLKRLGKTKKGVAGEDLHEISVMKTHQQDLKKELKILRGK